MYIIVQHEDDYIFELFERLQYSGIGGKRSNGLGRFSFKIEPCFEFHDDSPNLILLNSAMAKDSELKKNLKMQIIFYKSVVDLFIKADIKSRIFTHLKLGQFRNKFSGDVFDGIISIRFYGMLFRCLWGENMTNYSNT